ncbi:hypothetical protein Emtol_2838 [Emticicia oligotrophica DSM 17448]|uniref:DUF4136 domain-containing protein n=1 Tax=Emticicia oligotrophica (strain DSM 17448 / CIP 109782 / MTCC 6937 / GPTSA100-15) TaxID=929562 RepID=A0ABM5N3P9_EMTOG|nr:MULTISPECIES: DUF4136 domain-containing protein [Emticicia]AFK03972.1 hypothetical protein Emtol_2838 [Emticicia oligotrophica DSM 17448]
MKRIGFVIFLVIGLGACSRKLHIEREPNIAIEKYRNYTWNKLEATKASHPLYSSEELNETIIRKVDKILAQKGFRRNIATPDFFVDFHIYVEEQKFQNLVCGAGFYRGERYLPDLSQRTYCESPEIVNYDNGTLIIDIVDAQTGQLVWRGAAEEIIDNPAYAATVFEKKVKRILRKFPSSKGETKAKKQDVEKVISVN